MFGIKIPKNKFYKKEIVKAFDHSYGKDMKYCPNTGRPLWKEELTSIMKDDVDNYDVWDKKEIVIFDENRFSDDYVYIVDGKTIFKSEDLMYDVLNSSMSKNEFNEKYEKGLVVIEKIMKEQGIIELFNKDDYKFIVNCVVG